MPSLELIIPGQPQGKKIVRVRYKNKYSDIKIDTPDGKVAYQTLIKHLYTTKYPDVMLEGGVGIEITAYCEVPNSFGKKKSIDALSGLLLPEKRPDPADIAKNITEILTGVAYKDINQIVKLSVNKYYDERPRVEVVLWNVQ